MTYGVFIGASPPKSTRADKVKSTHRVLREALSDVLVLGGFVFVVSGDSLAQSFLLAKTQHIFHPRHPSDPFDILGLLASLLSVPEKLAAIRAPRTTKRTKAPSILALVLPLLRGAGVQHIPFPVSCVYVIIRTLHDLDRSKKAT